DIQGNAMERVLKIIATEKTHVARAIGQNQSMVTLSSVLCVDTNRTVALSDEMNGRKVLIQFKDRPKEETDFEREQIFKPYWQAFADSDKNPKIDGCIGFLLNSLEYFQKIGKWYQWKDVEVFNDIDLDEFQIALINALQEVDFV
ncbi:phage resistance protein, partial [Streptococcus uberis]